MNTNDKLTYSSIGLTVLQLMRMCTWA